VLGNFLTVAVSRLVNSLKGAYSRGCGRNSRPAAAYRRAQRL
jgi:hypothetical protein